VILVVRVGGVSNAAYLEGLREFRIKVVSILLASLLGFKDVFSPPLIETIHKDTTYLINLELGAAPLF